MIFLFSWKRGLKFLQVSVNSSFVFLYPTPGPTDSHCPSSSAAVATVHRTIQFLPCPHTKRMYQPLFIPCHELEWKMFGISSALYESSYKRITLRIGDHMPWFPQNGALSSSVRQRKAFWQLLLRMWQESGISTAAWCLSYEKTVIQLWTKTSLRDMKRVINHSDSEVHFYQIKCFILI